MMTTFLFVWALLLTIACVMFWYLSNHQIFISMTVFHNRMSIF